jgi:hypothetical protein
MNQMIATMQAIRMRMIGQSDSRSSPTRPALKTKAKPTPDPTYLQQPMQGVKTPPKKSPKHIFLMDNNIGKKRQH